MNIVISGCDLIGLIVAQILMENGHNVCVVDNTYPGSSIELPTFKYLENTEDVKTLLDKLGTMYCEYSIMCGIMINGDVVVCKKNLSESVQYSYWAKTRLILPSERKVIGVTDLEATSSKSAIYFEWETLLKPLKNNIVVKAKPDISYDLHIATLPLWKYKIPGSSDAMCVDLNLVPVNTIKEPYIKWDIVYTPFTPGETIHRLYHNNDGYICEFSGVKNEESLASDLNFLFPEGWCLNGDIKTTYGHFLPIPTDPEWPKGVIPIGKFSKWNESITITQVIKDTLQIAKYGKLNGE